MLICFHTIDMCNIKMDHYKPRPLYQVIMIMLFFVQFWISCGNKSKLFLCIGSSWDPCISTNLCWLCPYKFIFIYVFIKHNVITYNTFRLDTLNLLCTLVCYCCHKEMSTSWGPYKPDNLITWERVACHGKTFVFRSLLADNSTKELILW